MDKNPLYAHIFNLSAPWQVQSLYLDEKSGSVTVNVGISEHTKLTCPTCGKSCSIHYHRRRKWRHLDTSQFTTLVEANVPPRARLPDTVSSLGGARLPLHFAVRSLCSFMAES